MTFKQLFHRFFCNHTWEVYDHAKLVYKDKEEKVTLRVRQYRVCPKCKAYRIKYY